MPFQSVLLMTFFDLLIVVACATAVVTLLRHGKHIAPRMIRSGVNLVLGGLSAIGVFYTIDLLVMHVLPLFAPEDIARRLLHQMHLGYSWYVIAFGTAAIASGFARNILHVSAIIASDRVNRARFRDIAEVSGDWIWEMDRELRFTFLSDRFYELFSLKPADIIGRTRAEFAGVHANSDEWRRHVADLAERREFRGFEYAITLPDGAVKHLRISGKPVFDEDGAFEGYRGTGTDRTAEVEARRALEEGEKQFRDLIEGSLQGVLIHSNWDVLFANQALADILGYTSHLEILDRSRVEDLIAPNDLERLRGYLEARQRLDQAPETYECECLKKNGSRIWAEFRDTMTTWRGQRAVQCVVVDISERKRAEAALHKQNEELRRRDQELRDQNERFIAALENMSQGVAMFDKDSKLVVCNERFATMYGQSPEELQPGMRLADIVELRIANGVFAGDSPEAYRKERLEWIRTDKRSSRLQRVNDGRHIEIKRKMLSDGGWLATHDDITERKRAEAALHRQNLEMRRRDQELREQNERFNLALEHMTQGLAMFDKDSRLIVSNERYARLYGLDSSVVKPGLTLTEILELRITDGLYGEVGPEEYLRQTLDWVESRTRARRISRLSNGRVVEVLHQPVAGGGWLTTHQDVTERIRTETALKTQNERFNAALDNMSQGLCLFDSEQRLIVCNQSYAEMYKLPPEVMKPGQTSLREILEYRIANGIYAGATPEEYLSERQAWVAMGRRACKVQELNDGRAVAITHQPMSDGGWLTTHEDVSERRRTEALNLRLARIVENSINEVYVFDARSLRFLQVNASACRNLGYTMGELAGLTPVDLQPELTRASFDEKIAPLRGAAADHLKLEATFRRKNGTRYDVEIVLQQIESADRPVFAAIVEDVTERKRALAALRESQELFAKALQVSPGLIAISRPRDGAHYYVNEAWLKTLGYTRAEAREHSAVELGIWADSGERARFVEALESHGSVRGFEAKFRTRSGDEIDCLISGEFLQVGGQPRLFVVSEDVTQRKRAKAELIAHRDHLQTLVEQATAELKEKAEQLERALDKEKRLNELQRQFVSMASHEFRTPLAIIDSSIQRLLRTGDDLTRDKLETRAKRIRDAVKLMSTLMESTLSAALMDAGKILVNIEPCDLRRVVSQVCTHQTELNEDRRIVADLEALPDEIAGDAAALNQVFANLLSNAVKYSTDGEITVTGGRDGDWALVSVRDRGIGIDKDDLPQMFSRFFRAKTSTGIAGTGIGLNLVKTLVEMQGGSIAVESVKGEGSVFTVRLPISGSWQRDEAEPRVA